MKVAHAMRTVALGTMLAIAAFAVPAYAADGDGLQSWQVVAAEVKQMANKDGMVSKKDFIAIMEKRFDAMDTAKKGMLSPADIMKLFPDKGA